MKGSLQYLVLLSGWLTLLPEEIFNIKIRSTDFVNELNKIQISL